MTTHDEPVILPDYARVNILNGTQVEFWSKHLGVTEKQLRYAVFISGPIVKDIKAYISRHYKKKL